MLSAGGQGTQESAAALEQLCRTYWYPLYAYLRRSGHRPEEAEDLVQGYFLHLLESHSFETVKRERGRFRSFLLGALKNFVSDQKDKARAQKRGGGRQLISLEFSEAEDLFLREPANEESPERLFDRRWVLALLERAMERLRQECALNGKTRLFRELKGFIAGEKGETSYEEAAGRLNLSASALKSAIFRLRRRYYELVREEVGHTVEDPRELKDELRRLLNLFESR